MCRRCYNRSPLDILFVAFTISASAARAPDRLKYRLAPLWSPARYAQYKHYTRVKCAPTAAPLGVWSPALPMPEMDDIYCLACGSIDNLKACSPGGRLGSAGVMLRVTDEQEYPWMRDASLAPYVPSMLGFEVPHSRPDRVAPTPRRAARRRATTTLCACVSALLLLTESASPTP